MPGDGRQIVSQDNPKRRQPTRRSGRDPGSRPYAPITSRSGKPGRKHYPHSPCRLGGGAGEVAEPEVTTLIARLCVNRLCGRVGLGPGIVVRLVRWG